MRKGQWHMKVNIFGLAVGYINVTINRNRETQNGRFQMTGIGQGLAYLVPADQFLGQFWI
jgi:hypothetical protein